MSTPHDMEWTHRFSFTKNYDMDMPQESCDERGSKCMMNKSSYFWTFYTLFVCFPMDVLDSGIFNGYGFVHFHPLVYNEKAELSPRVVNLIRNFKPNRALSQNQLCSAT